MFPSPAVWRSVYPPSWHKAVEMDRIMTANVAMNLFIELFSLFNPEKSSSTAQQLNCSFQVNGNSLIESRI
jgi:hypothetical protein